MVATLNGEHFAVYRTVESLCYTPETNRALYIIFQLKKQFIGA